MFKLRALFIATVFTQLCVRVDIFFTCGKQFHDRFMDYWENKTNSTPPLFIAVPVSSHDSERSWVCVLVESILPFLIHCGTVQRSV